MKLHKNALLLVVGGLLMTACASDGTEESSNEAANEETEIVENAEAEANEAEEAERLAAAEEQARKEEEEAERLAAEEEQARKEAEEAAKEPVTLTGSGDQVTDAFELNFPYSLVSSSDDGSSNFIVRMHRLGGDDSDGLVNEIGPYSGKQFIAHDPAEYRLEVRSEGSWEITFDPRIPTEGESSPISGTGDQVVFLEIESGSYVLEASDDGNSNFIVRVNDSSSLVNEIAPYTGQSIANFNDSGVYAISVRSEGNWTLDFTE